MSNLSIEKNSKKFQFVVYDKIRSLWDPEKKMNLKIISISLILTLFLAPKMYFINAQEDTTNSIENELIDPAIFVMIQTQAENREQEIQQLIGDTVLSYAIAQSWMKAQQAMEMARNYKEDPYEAVKQYLGALKQYRNILRKYVKENPGTYETEKIEITTADEDISKATDEDIIAARNQLVKQFQEQFQNRLTEMHKNIDDIKDDISPQDVEKARQSIIKTEKKLSTINERIQSGVYEGIIDELEEATKFLDEEFSDLDPSATQMIQTLNKLEAKIQKIMLISIIKAEKGEDTSEEETILDELRDNKEKIKAGLSE